MKTFLAVVSVLVVGAVLAVAGCRHRVIVHERAYVAPAPAYVEEPGYVVVREAPPPIIVERRPAAPAVGYIWIEGYWHWGGRGYTWERGRWDRPPRPHTVWVVPRYERRDREYQYTPGHWRDEGRGPVPERGRPEPRGR